MEPLGRVPDETGLHFLFGQEKGEPDPFSSVGSSAVSLGEE